MPNVLFVTPSAYTLGGLATWLRYLDPGLRRCGWDVCIGLVEGPREHRPKRYLRQHPHESWISIPCRSGTPEGRCRAIVRSITRQGFDVVVGVNIPDVYPAVARLKSSGRTIRSVMAIHGIQPDLYDDAAAFRQSLDAVICTNQLACHFTRTRSRVDEGRVHYAPCGVAVDHPVKPRRESDRLRIAYVGRLEQKQKRVLDLPEILRDLANKRVPFKMLIAGSGPEEQALRELVQKVGVAPHVEFLGMLSPEDVRVRVYDCADVLLVPSFWETGPIVIWEAWASGVAVVSSRYVGSGLEGALVHGHNALLYYCGDTQSAASRLQRLHAQPSRRAEIIEAGFDTVKSRYSVTASVDAWTTALRTVLDAPLASGGSDDIPHRNAGRLDRWLGHRHAEAIRSALGTTCPDQGPGGEWPHSYGSTPYDDPDFWRDAEAADVLEQHAPTSVVECR